jgi:hypothetical protein
VAMIERNYSRFITDHADALVRGAMLNLTPREQPKPAVVGSRPPHWLRPGLGNTAPRGPPSLLDETWEWLDRAEQAREVAGLLSGPAASDALMRLAESYERLSRAAVNPIVLRRRELARSRQEGNS